MSFTKKWLNKLSNMILYLQSSRLLSRSFYSLSSLHCNFQESCPWTCGTSLTDPPRPGPATWRWCPTARTWTCSRWARLEAGGPSPPTTERSWSWRCVAVCCLLWRCWCLVVLDKRVSFRGRWSCRWRSCRGRKLTSDPRAKAGILRSLWTSQCEWNWTLRAFSSWLNDWPLLLCIRRPESSFFWMANPLGAFKHVLFRRSRKYFMVLAMVAMAALMVLTALYSLPGYTVKKLIGA